MNYSDFYIRQAERVNSAKLIGREMAKIRLLQFLQASYDIPRESGSMLESAIDSLLNSGLGSDFELMIWFNTYYADRINEDTHFLDKIRGTIFQIVQESLQNAFDSNGIKAEVKISG